MKPAAAIALDRTVVAMVTLDVAIVLKRNTEGATEHVALAGAPEQLSDTGPVKPFREVSCTALVPVLPACTISGATGGAIAKSGTGSGASGCSSTER